jgi:uncharacterized RDD family membrane protein YckC
MNNFEPNQEQNNNLNENQQQKFRDAMPDYTPSYSIWDYRVGFGRRAIAAIIDYFFVTIIAFVFAYAAGTFSQFTTFDLSIFTNKEAMEELIKSFLPLSILVTTLYSITEVLLAGTPGKYLMGIIIADEKMLYASYNKLIIRFLLKHLTLLFQIIYVLTWIQIFSTLGSFWDWVVIAAFLFVFKSDKQSLYDKVAKTAVYFKKEVDANTAKQ